MSHENRVEAAVLSGSDYNSSVKGIGIKKAVHHIYLRRNLSDAV
jgi:5'-3' exonuclease